jgi:peptidoglycan L-alanyl-D-glutamate endopeptidase CwlK
MYKFSKRSQTKLNTCHIDLRIICNEAIKIFDFTVTEGSRSLERQIELFDAKKSKLNGIDKKSKHQVTKADPYSKAVDIAPYPIDYKDKSSFFFLAGIMNGIALKLLEEGRITHKLRWGGDWDSDNNFKDQSFNDLPHFELMPIKKK